MWNNRILKDTDVNGTTLYSLYEVFYNEAGEIAAHSEEPVGISHYEDIDGLLESLLLMVSDVEQHISGEKDILTLNNIEFKNFEDDDDKNNGKEKSENCDEEKRDTPTDKGCGCKKC